jgi:hypothetical protein
MLHYAKIWVRKVAKEEETIYKIVCSFDKPKKL